jgi:hypothetical protein
MTPPDHPPAAETTAPNRAAVIAEVRELFLDRVEKAVRAAGVEAPVSIAALRAGAVQLLDQMTTEGARTGFALANSLTASQIRLVDDNQLELSIRLGDLSKRLRDECSGFLYKFHQRFATLLDRPSLRVADDPLSPEAICRALAEMFGSTEGAHQPALGRLAEIETHLASELPLMYAELSELLVRHQVAPAKLQGTVAETRTAGHHGRRSGEGAAMPWRRCSRPCCRACSRPGRAAAEVAAARRARPHPASSRSWASSTSGRPRRRPTCSAMPRRPWRRTRCTCSRARTRWRGCGRRTPWRSTSCRRCSTRCSTTSACRPRSRRRWRACRFPC